jgi:phage-related protein
MEGLKGLLGGVWDLITLLGEGIFNLLKGTFEWMAENLSNVITGIFKFALGLVVDLVTGIGSFILGIFTRLSGQVMSLLPNSVQQGLRGLMAPISKIFAAIKEIFLGLFTLDFDRILAGLGKLGMAILETFATWGKFLINAFSDGFAAVVKYFSDVASELTDMLYKAIFEPIVNAVKDAWAAAKDSVSGVGDAISGAWDATKEFTGFGDGGEAKTHLNPLTPVISPFQMLPAAGASPSFNSSTTVNLTVPAGTSGEQVSFLQNAAKQSFGSATDDKLARDISVYGR